MDDKSHLVENRIFAALLISVTSWGLATGIELLRLRPWARLSMPVFQGLLCVCGALPVVVLIVVGFFKSNTGGVAVGRFAEAIGITAWFVLVFVTIGVYGTFLSGPLANCNVPRRKKVPG